jgi:nucleoid-associated protein YgaU
MTDEVVMIETDKGLKVGSWKPAGELVDNYTAQEDIGWHIFHALRECESVTVKKAPADWMKRAIAAREEGKT